MIFIGKTAMKNIRKLLLWFIVIASVTSCGLFHKQPQNYTYGTSMRILYERDFTRAQFDSLCVADTIPANLKLWKSQSFRDYETNKLMKEYLYIKRLGSDEELFRLMMPTDTTYNIYKRITYGNKEE